MKQNEIMKYVVENFDDDNFMSPIPDYLEFNCGSNTNGEFCELRFKKDKPIHKDFKKPVLDEYLYRNQLLDWMGNLKYTNFKIGRYPWKDKRKIKLIHNNETLKWIWEIESE